MGDGSLMRGAPTIPALVAPFVLSFGASACAIRSTTDEDSLSDLCVAFFLKGDECYGDPETEEGVFREYCDEREQMLEQPDYAECGDAYADWWACMSGLSCAEIMGPDSLCPEESKAVTEVCTLARRSVSGRVSAARRRR